MIKLIDSHSHLDVQEFDGDRDAVIHRARCAGVLAQIVPATTAVSWPGIRQLCASSEGLYPAYGLHPTFLEHHRPAHLDTLAEWIDREAPVAIGECGMDLWVDGLDPALQRHYFVEQLKLARRLDLPVIVHARKAYDEVASLLRQVGGLRGVVHSFSGSLSQAEQLWKLGFLIGIGGPVTYPRARRLRSIVATMPLDRLLIETDSPDQPLCGYQGHRNEPARLIDVLDTIASLRRAPPDELAEATSENAARLFGLRMPHD